MFFYIHHHTDRITHTTAFVIPVMEHWMEREIAQWVHHEGLIRERERNVLFNDALNTFYLRLYGVRHMVKDHSDSMKGNPLPPHRLLLSFNSKGSFICTIPDRITHTTAFVTPVDWSDDPSHHVQTLLPLSYISLELAINWLSYIYINTLNKHSRKTFQHANYYITGEFMMYFTLLAAK